MLCYNKQVDYLCLKLSYMFMVELPPEYRLKRDVLPPNVVKA